MNERTPEQIDVMARDPVAEMLTAQRAASVEPAGARVWVVMIRGIQPGTGSSVVGALPLPVAHGNRRAGALVQVEERAAANGSDRVDLWGLVALDPGWEIDAQALRCAKQERRAEALGEVLNHASIHPAMAVRVQPPSLDLREHSPDPTPSFRPPDRTPRGARAGKLQAPAELRGGGRRWGRR